MLIEPVITHLDPWLKKPVDLVGMKTAVFVGQYDLPIECITTITEMLYLSGGPIEWSLWSTQQECRSTSGLAVKGIFQGSPEEAATFLFRALQQAQFPYTGATEPYVGGLLSAEQLREVVECLQFDMERIQMEASSAVEQNPPSIITTARLLKMNPQPSGQSPNNWYADCPSGQGHKVQISVSGNEFGCGYCREKGGPEELKIFWKVAKGNMAP